MFSHRNFLVIELLINVFLKYDLFSLLYYSQPGMVSGHFFIHDFLLNMRNKFVLTGPVN